MANSKYLGCPDRSAGFQQRLSDTFFQHHNPWTHRPIRNKYMVVKYQEEERVEEVREITVHQFIVSDVEDPDLYAAEPLLDWEKSEQGQWVMKNAADVPVWHRMIDPVSYGNRYAIRAKFTGPALTEWLLRYAGK